MATGILHNVGNVINSVNLSAVLLRDMLAKSSVDKLQQTSQIINEHRDDLGEFVTHDERGKLIPAVLERLVNRIADERKAFQREVSDLLHNVAHIKEIVSAQQSMAKPTGLQVQVDLASVMERALVTRRDALAIARIEITRQYEEVPMICADEHRLLQILVNLIKNAEESIVASDPTRRELTLCVRSLADDRVAMEVTDSGLGVAPEDVAKLFQRGFTTKKDGHGFGLHSSANTARELHGQIVVHSDGMGHGATFRLELPITSPPDCSPPT